MKVLRAAADALQHGRAAVLVTVIGVKGSAPRRGGARMLVYADGSSLGTVGGGHWEHLLVQEALEALALGRSRRVAKHLTQELGMCCGGAMEAMLEVLDTHPELHVWGAGHVAQQLVPLALGLDFQLHVYDDRDALLDLPAFDGCTRIPGDPRDTLPSLGPGDFGLILTHDHQLDQDLVRLLLPAPFAYLGMIGSRAKVTRFFQRLQAAGMSPELFTKLSAPVGLSLGAVTPQEIAVSIAAELIQVRRGQRAIHNLSTPKLQARPAPALPPALRDD